MITESFQTQETYCKKIRTSIVYSLLQKAGEEPENKTKQNLMNLQFIYLTDIMTIVLLVFQLQVFPIIWLHPFTVTNSIMWSAT